jgi:hypothetical protein
MTRGKKGSRAVGWFIRRDVRDAIRCRELTGRILGVSRVEASVRKSPRCSSAARAFARVYIRLFQLIADFKGLILKNLISWILDF